MSRPPASVPVILVHGFASSFERNWGEAGGLTCCARKAAP